jgi:cyclophilin family peptidyl-prolyl cis-trans isomerase
MRARHAFAALLLAVLGAAPAAGQPRLADERILLRTTHGDLVLALYPDVAPKHVAQLLELVRLGVYDSSWFYRVEPRFVAQLTDAANRRRPLSPGQQAALRPIPAEFSPALTHRPGTLSMARRDDDPDSAETSFSFLLGPAPHLDGKYTIFGELAWGVPVLESIASAPLDARHSPRTPIVVEEARVVPAADIGRMILAGELRGPQPVAEAEPAPGSDTVVRVGVALMMASSLLALAVSGRWAPQRASAFVLLTVLIGGFLLMRELVPRARDHELLATALFFGVVGLFKLMNRFESAPRG